MTKFYNRLILASASPRRKELLASAGLTCEIHVADIHEQPQPNETPLAYVLRNASEKAVFVAQSKAFQTGEALILAADTVVVSAENKILEKPLDAQHARQMLQLLSDKIHSVLTGYAIVDGTTGQVLKCEAVETFVRFRALSQVDVDAYVATGEPFDKAGSYGIQGQAAHFVKSVEGSYTNVVGLPLAEVVVAVKGLMNAEQATNGLSQP